MGVQSLSIAATGMTTLLHSIDITANNLANVKTTGFKKQRAEFQDLFYLQTNRPGFSAGQLQTPTGIQQGLGVKLSATNRMFIQGPLEETGNDLDIAIEGNGFFRVILPNGQVAYTRDGSFKKDKDGNLLTSGGLLLSPNINIPANIVQINVDVQGRIQGIDPLTPETPVDIGQITLVRFPNPAGLQAIGDNLFVQSGASGDPIEAIPGSEGLGILRQKFLESSNVEVVKELVNLITAQRAFEMNSKVIQASDEMLQTIATLKR
jgi:flagellar basal-body rod protein FlgG